MWNGINSLLNSTTDRLIITKEELTSSNTFEKYRIYGYKYHIYLKSDFEDFWKSKIIFYLFLYENANFKNWWIIF